LVDHQPDSRDQVVPAPDDQDVASGVVARELGHGDGALIAQTTERRRIG
jgi:hypothetical protein